MTLPPGEIHVWHVALDGGARLATAGAAMLDASELARARRLVLDADRERFVLSRIALRCVLGSVLDVAPSEVRIAPGPHGKPSLGRGHDLRFNLSQSGRFALVAVARDVPVGVDIERVRPWPARDGDLLDLLGARERDLLTALPVAARPLAFARRWTRIEAVAKAHGTGLSVAGTAGVGSGCGQRLAGLPAADAPRLADLPAADGYAASVAWLGGPHRIVNVAAGVAALVGGQAEVRRARTRREPFAGCSRR